MDVKLDPDQERELQELAKLLGKSAETVAAELLAQAICRSGSDGESTPPLDPSAKNGGPTFSFHDSRTDLDELIQEQNVQPASDLARFRADFWPPEEDADEFLATLAQWRRDEHDPKTG